jgi:RNA polymerase II-associated factor 1
MELRGNTQQSASTLSPHSDFLCALKFNNRVPDVPYDMKFLRYPFDHDRFIKYTPTLLEQHYMHEIVTDVDQGLDIDLIDPDAYNFAAHLPVMPLTSEDSALLPEHVERQLASLALQRQSTAKNSTTLSPTLNATLTASHLKPSDTSVVTPSSPLEPLHTQIPKSKPVAPWLRKTVYLSTPTATSTPTKSLEREPFALIRIPLSQQIEQIEKSFEKAQEPPVHPHNPQLTPVQVLPLYPDFSLWCNTYQEVIFDTDPAPTHLYSSHKRKRSHHTESLLSSEEREELMSQAILKGFKKRNPLNEKEVISFVAYLVPNKRRKTNPQSQPQSQSLNNNNTNNSSQVTENEEQEYYWVREYTYQVKQSEAQDSYLFIFHEDHVTYVPIAQTILLQKMSTGVRSHSHSLSFTHSYSLSLSYSLIHSFTHSLIHTFTHSHIHTFTHSLIDFV